MPETTQDMSPDTIRPNTIGAKRAGIMGGTFLFGQRPQCAQDAYRWPVHPRTGISASMQASSQFGRVGDIHR